MADTIRFNFKFVASAISGAAILIGGVMWLGNVAANAQSALEQTKVLAVKQVDDHNLLVQIANDVRWLREAVERLSLKR